MGQRLMKSKKCKGCYKEFIPWYSTTQSCCSSECAIKLSKALQEKKAAKESKQQKAVLKESLLTKSDWTKAAQQIFNTYIRLRDKDKPCISCGNQLVGKYDAGHYFSVGAYPALRFDEDNVFGQCVHCNQHKHGNISEYSITLPERIGELRFSLLLERRNSPLRLSIPEIQDLIKIYKGKVKELSK